ncbi:MAG: hypothetical protein ACLS6O_01520 [Bifidobacterium sp.]
MNTGGTVTLPDTVNVKKATIPLLPCDMECGRRYGSQQVDQAAGSTYAFNVPGTYTITGTLAESSNFNPGRTFRRTIDVSCSTRFPEVGRKPIGRAAARARFLRPAVLMTSRYGQRQSWCLDGSQRGARCTSLMLWT